MPAGAWEDKDLAELGQILSLDTPVSIQAKRDPSDPETKHPKAPGFRGPLSGVPISNWSMTADNQVRPIQQIGQLSQPYYAMGSQDVSVQVRYECRDKADLEMIETLFHANKPITINLGTRLGSEVVLTGIVSDMQINANAQEPLSVDLNIVGVKEPFQVRTT